MTVMAHEPMTTQADVLLETFLALETPDGIRAELIEGEIVVSPAPEGNHEDHISTLIRQVLRHSAVDMDVSGHKGLSLPKLGPLPRDHVIPDVTFAPREKRLFRDAPSWMPCGGVAMVAEVTSSRAERDRTQKRRSYARAQIPHYLLFDRELETVTLHSEPGMNDYRTVLSVVYGKALLLPEPFGFELETADLM
ncbi:Uma2 family endonuclease [Streptomyces sp. JH002]|uniref:Uma2 family endonuclease n=1 Tax=Streptomyces sp. JH002 TaxID=2763259 RepID=UPI003D8044E0